MSKCQCFDEDKTVKNLQSGLFRLQHTLGLLKKSPVNEYADCHSLRERWGIV